MTRPNSRPRFLMCPPEHFAVNYAINPWMDPNSWARDDQKLAVAARQEWIALHHALRDLGAMIEFVAPVAGLPDLVFTANAAVILDGTALLARFRHGERTREEPHYEAAFRALQARGVIDRVKTLPDSIVLEGAGDCVFDHARKLFWLGFGPRSDAAARHAVMDTFGMDVVALRLADARFYHMDTALSALPNGEVMYVPEAFTAKGRGIIHDHAAPDERIEVSIADACQLAANAVCVGDTLVMAGCGDRLRAQLNERGYRVVVTPLHSFLRSGGAAFCLTLRLDRRSLAMAAPASRAAVA